MRKQLNWRYVCEDDIPIIKDSYNELMEYCFAQSVFVSFSDVWYGGKKQESFMRQLSNYHVATIQTRRWCYMDFSRMDFSIEPNQGFVVVYIYKSCDDVKNIIKEHTDNLFFLTFTDDGNLGINPYMLEDLCFFRNNKVLLSTSTHDFRCTIYPESDEEIALFKKILLLEKSIASINICDVDAASDIDLASFNIGGLLK